MGKEDRRAKRADLSMPVSSAKLIKTDTIVNLSTHGAFIRSVKPLPIGEELSLKFSLPNVEFDVEIDAHVVWNHTTGDNIGMGVEFLGLSEHVFDQLLGYIEKLYS
jgi:Tfp pilus assembly protein PilZ